MSTRQGRRGVHAKTRNLLSVLVAIVLVAPALLAAPPAEVTPPKAPTDVLAEIGTGTTITRAQFDEQIERIPPRQRMQLQSPEGRRQLLKQMAEIALLKIEAGRRGLADKPALQDQMRKVSVQAVAQAYVEGAAAATPPAAEAVKKFYETHQDDFRNPLRWHMWQITVDDGATAAAALKKEIEGGRSFAEVASASSSDGFKGSGGDRGFVTSDDLEGEVGAAARSLKDNEISAPLTGAEGKTVLVKFAEKSGGDVRPLPEVTDAINRQLQNEGRQAAMEKLRDQLAKEHGLKLYPERFEVLARPPAEGELGSAAAQTVLFEIGSEATRVSDVEPELAQIPPFLRPQFLQGENLKDFVEQAAFRRLVMTHAERNFEQLAKAHPQAVADAREHVAVRGLIEEEVLEKIKIDDEALKAYYLNNQHQFQKPERYRASHILVDAEASATALLEQLNKGVATFSELARAHSKCPSKEKGGDLDWFSKGQMVPEFEKACAENPVGKLVGPVKTQFGHHIIMVTGKEPAGAVPFEEVKDRLRQNMLQEKQKETFEQYLEQLRKGTAVKEYPERL